MKSRPWRFRRRPRRRLHDGHRHQHRAGRYVRRLELSAQRWQCNRGGRLEPVWGLTLARTLAAAVGGPRGLLRRMKGGGGVVGEDLGARVGTLQSAVWCAVSCLTVAVRHPDRIVARLLLRGTFQPAARPTACSWNVPRRRRRTFSGVLAGGTLRLASSPSRGEGAIACQSRRSQRTVAAGFTSPTVSSVRLRRSLTTSRPSYGGRTVIRMGPARRGR
jgi:hypothetical protein